MLTIVSLQRPEGNAAPLKVDRCHVKVTIKNRSIRTKIDQVFTNPNDFQVDGIYIFPVLDGSVFSNRSLTVDGDPIEGAVFSERDADGVYRTSASHSGNRAILEHLGTQAFVAEVPEIPANGVRHVQFEYSQVISTDDDLARYRYPLALAKAASVPITNLFVDMEIESDTELRTIHSPSHEIVIDRKDDHHVTISYEGRDVDPDNDFLCDYSVSDEDFGITLLTHRANEREDGYFMLLVSPKYEVEETDIIEKDFIFVLDRSGSMARRKMEQAKAALRYCVENLNDGDRFNLILFNEYITSLASRLNGGEDWFGHQYAQDSEALSSALIDVKDGRERALSFIDGIEAGGGTNINDALLTALAESPDPQRPRIIVFLTDGQPTAGETQPARILRNIAEANQSRSRVFVFGVGYDVNDRMLDKMAADNGGTGNYVTPDEDIEVAVSSLFRKMNDPVLVEVGLNFGQILTKALTPQKLPDLFRGEQLTLLGRYEGHGDTVLTLRGSISGEAQEFARNVQFAKIEEDNEFLIHLWAESRIAELVGEVILNGGSEELRKEIESLSTEYGVLTPYTSLVDADDGSLRQHYTSQMSDAYTGAIQDRIGRTREMYHQHYTHVIAQDGDIKRTGDKRFRQRNGIWIDNEYDGVSARKQIEFGSREYFDLMDQVPRLGRYLKVGESMILCHGGVNYEITPRKA